MKLYLMRHASAVDIAPTDAARSLSSRGIDEARRAGLALRKLDVKISRIYSSPLLRARQTAELAAGALGFRGTTEALSELINGTPTTILLHAVMDHNATGEVLVVGHMPSLAGHLGELVENAPSGGFTPAGAACVELKTGQLGTGKLIWFKQYPDLAKLAQP